jgi:CDP-diglyceride synthetase
VSTVGGLIGQCFWLAGPVALAGILHMVAVKRNLWARLAVPIDGGRTLGGVPILGPNKTWRGVVFMIVCASLLGAIQGFAFGDWAAHSGVSPIDFRHPGALSYGAANALLAAGYVLGELPNSFAKRRLEITPGATSRGFLGAFFFVLDQADSVVAALALGAVVFSYGWDIVVVGSICLSLVHLALNLSLYLARVRKNL